MSAVRKLLGDFLHPSSHNPAESSLEPTLRKVVALKTQQLQQFIREMSHLVDQRQEDTLAHILALRLIKQLLIGGSYAAYLFSSVYVFPWVLSICNFHKRKPLEERSALLYKDVTGRTSAGTGADISSFKAFLGYAEQFLVFFGENLKFYPYSKYKIKNMLAKELQTYDYTRSLSQFTKLDLSNLQNNLKRRGVTFREELTDFTDFLHGKIEECVLDASTFHDNLYLIISLVEISESFCISIVAFRIGAFLIPERVETASKVIDFVMSTGEIEAIEAINIRCLPLILEYLLPVDFKENAVKEQPKVVLPSNILHRLIDYYYTWYEKTKLLKISTKIYQYSFGMIEYLKKPFKLTLENHIRDFMNNLEKIEQNNEVKRAFVIDQHLEEEQQIVHLLKEVAYCVNSQKIERRIAYSNVLDDLTITEKESISEFSESLLQSARKRQRGEMVSNKNETSLGSSRRLKNSDKISSRRSKKANQQENGKQQIQNIYYYKNGLPTSSNQHKASLQKATTLNQFRKGQGQLQSFENKKSHLQGHYYSKQCESYADVQYPSFPKVTSKDTRGKQVISSSKSDISLHSSQFSQKDNNQHRFNKPIESIYTDRSNKNELAGREQDKSGQFLYFEKQSELKSEKSQDVAQRQSISKTEVQFVDSLANINQSQSCEILEFGMDVNAKVPQTISKPKFNFKNTDTYDTEAILKNLQSPRSQERINVQPLTHIHRPQTMLKLNAESRTVTNKLKQSNFQAKQQFRPKISKIKSVDSGYARTPKQPYKAEIEVNLGSSESSASIIKENPGQPHLISESISLSNEGVPSNFKEVFRQKSEKASVLSSSRSLRKLRQMPERQVQIPDFKKLRNLQNQLGKLKKETEKYNKQLEEKNQEMDRLKKQKKQIIQNDPYFLKKQNQIMKILLKNKEKPHPIKNSHGSAKNLAKQLKESSIKNYNMSLKDYNSELLKLKFSNIKAYTKQQKKNIISNRCILLKNQLIEIGYSFKNNEVTLYLTLKNYCDSLEIDLLQNSINFSESIRRSFDKLYVGKQMKFKTEVNETKQNSKFEPAVVTVKLTYQHKLEQNSQEFACELPLTPYNMAAPLSQNEGASLLSESKNETTTYITPLYNSSEDFVKKGKQYLINMFSHGFFSEDGNIFTINYKWKGHIEAINIKIKQRAFRIEGTGFPLQSGRELIETIINLLTEGS